MAATSAYTTDSSSGTSCSTGTVWVKWNCGTSTATDTSWYAWQDDTACTYSSSSATRATPVIWSRMVSRAPELTAEQKAERQRQLDAAAAVRLQEEKQRRIAAEKAVALLKSLLTPEQLAAYEKQQSFHVIGSDGQRYEIDCSQPHRNVYAVDANGKRKKGYCANATGNVPVADNHLAQKLALETDAEAFKRVANSFPVAV